MKIWIWPLMLVVASNAIYNMASKAVPSQISPYPTLIMTYIVAAIVSGICYWVFDYQQNFIEAMLATNWTAWALGLSMVGLEAGYIYMYRMGIKISMASLLSNILLALILALIGVCFYKEKLNFQQIIGVLTCIAGSIILLTAPNE